MFKGFSSWISTCFFGFVLLDRFLWLVFDGFWLVFHGLRRISQKWLSQKKRTLKEATSC